jgi:hypothetical protein
LAAEPGEHSRSKGKKRIIIALIATIWFHSVHHDVGEGAESSVSLKKRLQLHMHAAAAAAGLQLQLLLTVRSLPSAALAVPTLATSRAASGRCSGWLRSVTIAVRLAISYEREDPVASGTLAAAFKFIYY